MKKAAIMAVAGMLLSSACAIGKNAADLAVAKSARGAIGTFQTEKGSVPLELLAVRDDGLILQDRSGRILFSPYGSIRRFTPQGFREDYALARGEHPSANKKSMLRAISHYPQGLSGDLERKLLDRAGQQEMLPVQ